MKRFNFLSTFIVLLFVIMILNGCDKSNNVPIVIDGSLKYCDTDDDCLTSCGEEIGRGECFNKKYISFDNPPDNICCACENCNPCYRCTCDNNICTPVRTAGDCC